MMLGESLVKAKGNNGARATVRLEAEAEARAGAGAGAGAPQARKRETKRGISLEFTTVQEFGLAIVQSLPPPSPKVRRHLHPELAATINRIWVSAECSRRWFFMLVSDPAQVVLGLYVAVPKLAVALLTEIQSQYCWFLHIIFMLPLSL
ncbi:hypothetical protein TIFTF001_029563 [Ficus carica]|uniref:Uncharacterized protein n=1 Tax=Ficus carica TaxID=3494 RepID=A0AA88DW58_FICCA|nr:hypothetical protein TIFTF001_029563 [Ficus carica]